MKGLTSQRGLALSLFRLLLAVPPAVESDDDQQRATKPFRHRMSSFVTHRRNRSPDDEVIQQLYLNECERISQSSCDQAIRL
jgi:hypothetical protein